MSRRGQRTRYNDEDRGWDRSRRVNGDYGSSSSLNSTSMTRELDDLMRTIENDWNVITQPNYSPVETAMQLMDRSSLGRDYNAFKSLHSRIERALQFVVNDHFQDFNNSIGLYRGLVLNLTASQERLRKLRDTLTTTKEKITKRGGDLSITLNRSQQYKEMLRLLDIRERLQAVPDKIETLITEKHFAHAVCILSEAIKTLQLPEFKNIGALQDVHAYLKNQEASLHDLLVEELHNHLYLKSPYCVDRWASYQPGQQHLPRKENVSKFVHGMDISSCLPRTRGLDILEDSMPYTGQHPESNSFNYITQIVFALHSLSQLHRAMDTVTQRLPLEVYQLVDKTIVEVEARHTLEIRELNSKSRRDRILETSGKSESSSRILADLLWTLYSKLAAVLSGHRVVHDCVLAIVKESNQTENLRDMPEFNYIEVWKPIQSEIRSLLLDYLTNDITSGSSMHQPSTSLNEMFTKRRAKVTSRTLFRLDYDQQSSRKSDEEEMYRILEVSVPGLVLQREQSKTDASTTKAGRSLDSIATGHKILIPPNAFNVIHLLPSTIAFLDRVKELIPPSLVSSTVTSFLDDFLVAVFLPQLEDTVSEAFTRITEDDEFQTAVGPDI